MTVEEAFAMMEDAEKTKEDNTVFCEIDAETRKVTVPETYKILGVESDEDSERVYFRAPRIVGDKIDLATLGLRINYQNANSQKDSYPVDDLTVENEFITFSWLLSRKAVAYKGSVKFIVCAVRIGDNAEISNEWNTTLASAEVLEGLEVDYSSIPEEEGKDLLEALIAQSQVKLMEVGEATEEAKRSAERADTAAQEANAATERANKAAQDAENVVAGKGFIATSEKGIAGGVATLDESGRVPKEQIPDISEKTVTFEMASQRAGVESGDSLAVAFGKLEKYCADLKPHVFVDPVNNLLGTDATLPLAATQGKSLDEKITESNGNLVYTQQFIPEIAKNNIITNLLNININGVMNEPYMYPGSVATEDASTLINSPMREGDFYAYREVFFLPNRGVVGNTYGKTIIRLTEAYPVSGRIWTNVYNTDLNDWTGWKSITPV